jgi:cytochrome c-type biogenesis protein CcmH/NrfG
MAMSFAIALLLAGTLFWLGWRLVQLDRQIAAQRMQEQRESAADLAVATLQRSVSQAEGRLATLAAAQDSSVAQSAGAIVAGLSEDSALVVARRGVLEAYPAQRLLFYPTAQDAAPVAVFAEPDELEFQRRDNEKALAALRGLTHASSEAVQASAWMRIARIQRKQGRCNDALKSYAEMIRLGGALAGEMPAELVARQARLSLFEREGRAAEARAEAHAMRQALDAKRYRLSRGAADLAR